MIQKHGRRAWPGVFFHRLGSKSPRAGLTPGLPGGMLWIVMETANTKSRRRVVGCMSGTSIDGLDAALVELEGAGLRMKAKLLATIGRPFGSLGGRLRNYAQGGALTARQAAELALELGEFHADLIQELLGGRSASADLIVAHGQTVYHAPPVSLQLLNANPIAHRLSIPVVFDLRAADLAAGGQGAPITPLADHLLLAGSGESRAVVNLGGFVNVTRLPESTEDDERDVEAIWGGDVCACNQILDEVARRWMDKPFDEDGRIAGVGRLHDGAMQSLDGLLAAQSGAGRSLGTGDEMNQWVHEWGGRIPAGDLARTACAAIAQSVARSVAGSGRVILAGGGARNRTLVEELAARCGAPVALSNELGVPIGYREAMEMAVLGALCQDRTPITLPRVTRRAAGRVISGTWVLP